MKAAVITHYGGPEVLVYQDVNDLVPAEDEVLIQVDTAVVNFADLLLRRGQSHGGPTPPIVPGLDVAGKVVAVGSNVDGFGAGDRVAASPGASGYAEFVAVRNTLVWHLPDDVVTEAAAALTTVGITAYNVLTVAGRLTAGDAVLVHSASGGVGTTAIQLAKILGAGLVIGTVTDPATKEFASSFGCDDVIVRGDEGFANRVLELTDNRGVNLILDSVAGDTFTEGFSCLAPFGRLVVFGSSSGEPGRITSDKLVAANQLVVGYSTGGYRRLHPEALSPGAEFVFGLLAEGRIKVSIGNRIPLEEARTAHELAESRSLGRILLIP